MNQRALLAAAGGAAGKLYIEDVFSAYPYTGTGAAQTITNGIDLTNGGLVWIKERSPNAKYHVLSDTVSGLGKILSTNSAAAQLAATGVSSVNNNGFNLAADASDSIGVGAAGSAYASWTFRRSQKFFDVVTWTGDGTSNRQIPHALGLSPGMVTVKRCDSTGSWITRHMSIQGEVYLNISGGPGTNVFSQITAMSGTTITVAGNANINGATYVAYLWAHDPDIVNGVIQCGAVNSDTNGTVTVNLGWEPQYVMVMDAGAQAPSAGSGSWVIADTARGLCTATTSPFVSANSAAAETSSVHLQITSNGFVMPIIGYAYEQIIYLAIRRGPMRTPTSGAQVYNAIARTGTSSAANVTGVGFPPDLRLGKTRSSGQYTSAIDRLRGTGAIIVTSTQKELSATDALTAFGQNGVSYGADSTYTNVNTLGQSYIDWFFRRAPGFLDIVCYAGTGVARTIPHNLGAAPGMMLIKDRTQVLDWLVYHQSIGAGNYLFLDTNAAAMSGSAVFSGTAPSASAFNIGISYGNVSGDNYVAYLFAALPGVSAIGSYTGNGATQTINCGFANGARFVLIKRTDAAGDWIVLDTVRGIVSGNDPYLLLDSSAAEVTTTDLLTPQSVGFGLTANALVNTSGGHYIYLAIA